MAKLNQSAKFARILSAVAGMEIRVTSDVHNALVQYHQNNLAVGKLAYIYTGIELAEKEGKVRPAQVKAINAFINTFAGVSIQKDLDDQPKRDANNGNQLMLEANKTKLTKALAGMGLDAMEASEERTALILEKMQAWLDVRGGNLFGREKKEKTVKTDEVKIEELKAGDSSKYVTKMKNLGMSQAEQVQELQKMAAAMGFTSLSGAQSFLDSL